MQAWDVYLDGELIDTVFYDSDCDADYVKRGLINNDAALASNATLAAEQERPRDEGDYSGWRTPGRRIHTGTNRERRHAVRVEILRCQHCPKLALEGFPPRRRFTLGQGGRLADAAGKNGDDTPSPV